MKITHLGAACAAAGVVVLGAAGPALATGATPPSPGTNITQQDAPPPPPKAPTRKPPSFGVTPRSFFGGDTLTFSVRNCPTRPTIKDMNNLFVSTRSFTSVGLDSYNARELTRKNLTPGKVYRVLVKCGAFSDMFSTSPQRRHKPTPTPTPSNHPTGMPTGTPSGAPQTGDGSKGGGANNGMIAAGAGVALAGIIGGGFVFARRRSSADA